MIAAALASLLWLTAASGALPQETEQSASSPAEKPTNLETVEVVASRQTVEERATAFVNEVGAPPPGAGLARWSGSVCVGVANLASPYSQLVADRVSDVAAHLGLGIGEPGCRANIMIVFADDASDVARKLVNDDKPGFMPATSRVNLGADALDAFKNSERPVRWWHVSMPVDVDTGRPPAITTIRTADGDEIEVPVSYVRQMSRTRSGIRNDLQRVIIVVDVTRLMGANLASVADYAAMIAMAQVNPDVDVAGQDSILSLFSSQRTADALTEWDINYLQALYGATPDRVFERQQFREIGRTMARRQLAEDDLP
jgi:hypothetical protein